MRLFYFTSERFGLEAIRDRRLKIARIDELNDPFEFVGIALNGRERVALRRTKERLSKTVGIICMSSDWRHPLLWGHYADKHRGLCLGFDVVDILGSDVESFEKLQYGSFAKVEYRPKRPKLEDLSVSSLKDLGLNGMKMLMSMKFKAWEYESEYRAFCRLDEKDPVSDLYFLPFYDEMKLAQVIVGERSSVTPERLAGVLRNFPNSVTTFKARAGFQSFEVVQNKSSKGWPTIRVD